ncbi:hypothetical protein [Rhodopseudomonas telluris]|uniref:Uncharacterized protein n=1 Tax=Rhodopseudomonas telluris TaxID=644215 RepID=A0ABV6ESK5_9BRAD
MNSTGRVGSHAAFAGQTATALLIAAATPNARRATPRAMSLLSLDGSPIFVVGFAELISRCA